MQKLALVVFYEGEINVVTTRTGVSSEAMRAYVRTLRKGRKVSQPRLADAIDMAVRTYKSWELGETETIKTPNLVRAVRFLNGSFDQLAEMADDATAEDGSRMAREWLDRKDVAAEFARRATETPEEASVISRLLDLLEADVPPAEAARRARLGQ